MGSRKRNGSRSPKFIHQFFEEVVMGTPELDDLEKRQGISLKNKGVPLSKWPDEDLLFFSDIPSFANEIERRWQVGRFGEEV